MFQKRICQWCAALGVVAAGGLAAAQAPVTGPSRVSDVSGYAGRELSNIYRQSVGTGYSVSSLNQTALRNARAQVPSVGQMSTGSRVNTFGAGSPLGKPFSSYSSSPTVSPYLNLFREDLEGNSDLNYQTLVRPMQQQQHFNEQIQRQSIEVARRLQTIAAQSNFNPQGSTTQYPTGHQTVFMYYGHYYPTPTRQRR